MDYSTPIDEPITKKFVIRHRLEKKNPELEISEAVEPIIYYLDPGTPEPVKSALLEGGRWWNQAYESIGFKDAFQVKMLPEGADPLDCRYNVIQWVHRSTRGWSYGASVVDPRTGEIIKGHVSLGSLRIRQDYMIAQALTKEPFASENNNNKMMELAIARIRQLSAHEIGHTIGFAHNFAASTNNRASVMDYPHPLVNLIDDEIVFDDAYDTGIGDWDKVTVAYSYSDFRADQNEDFEKNLKKKRVLIEQLGVLTESSKIDINEIFNLVDSYFAIGFVPKNEIKKMNDLFDQTIKSLINADGLSEEERNEIRTQLELTKLKKRPQSHFMLSQKEGQVKRKISSLENDINIWKTNIDFFASTKNAEKLKLEFNQKIKLAEKEVKVLKEQLLILRET